MDRGSSRYSGGKEENMGGVSITQRSFMNGRVKERGDCFVCLGGHYCFSSFSAQLRRGVSYGWMGGGPFVSVSRLACESVGVGFFF